MGAAEVYPYVRNRLNDFNGCELGGIVRYIRDRSSTWPRRGEILQEARDLCQVSIDVHGLNIKTENDLNEEHENGNEVV